MCDGNACRWYGAVASLACGRTLAHQRCTLVAGEIKLKIWAQLCTITLILTTILSTATLIGACAPFFHWRVEMAAATPSAAALEDAFRGASSGGLDLVLLLGIKGAAALSAVNKTLHERVDRWCKPAVAETAALQLAKIKALQASGIEGAAQMTFHKYRAFLTGLQELPLDNDVLNMPTYLQRFAAAAAPRPRQSCLERARFDWGYHGGIPEKGWCDVFGNGAPNDFVRRVGDHPNTYLALSVAGADITPTQSTYGLQHIPVGTAVAEVVEEELFGIRGYFQSLPSSKTFDRTYRMWEAVEERLGAAAPPGAASEAKPEAPRPVLGPGPPPERPPHKWLGTPPKH